MKRILGILGILIAVMVVTGILQPAFLSGYNLSNVTQLSAYFAILSIGVMFVIITGGIDLSIGPVVGLVGCLLPLLIVKYGFHPALAIAFVMGVAALIGTTHGLLITKAKLQPFVVTLCGWLIYRGLARWITGDANQGFGNSFNGLLEISRKKIPLPGDYQVPIPVVYMLIIAVLAAIFLNKTVWGRYLYAIGRNEQAAHFSGINTDRIKLMAYVLCSTIAGFGGVLLAFDLNSMQPSSHGNTYELYAIAAAVLGGCSLRGGEGSVAGVVIGAVLLRVLYSANNMLGIPSTLEYVTIGTVLLAGVLADEGVKWYSQRRKLIQSARKVAA
ncbi:inner-membrane translocator [Planctopirus limnophila DSM 3776]|uniref:Inner-membrane translocator n=1 Tax=Planctopirus limnophila (strain ATCC 43296 / DSM 3776 / IFAM 1008 / Mu 290) TaxID=521674 RepID=D5SRU1_PLAL2|nr:ABC transporter permease [Planctopirus limnophila]ADG66625.1 inner-membrane translocator [Planctopirus limnophila DSM 3776]